MTYFNLSTYMGQAQTSRRQEEMPCDFNYAFSSTTKVDADLKYTIKRCIKISTSIQIELKSEWSALICLANNKNYVQNNILEKEALTKN